MQKIPHAPWVGVLELVIPNILGMACAIIRSVVLGWLRDRRKRVRMTRDARARVQALEDRWETVLERVETALDGLRKDGAAWKLAADLQRRVEGLELRLTTHQQEMLAGLEAAHETARSAVNSVKGQRGGRGVAAERSQYEAFGRDIDAALKTEEGRAALIAQVRAMSNGAKGTLIPEENVVGDWTPGPG